MKKIAIIAWLVILWAVHAAAAVRTTDEALQIAASFTTPAGDMSAPARGQQSATIAAQGEAYIAVNTRGGFVLVGADDRLPEVLGYSDNGSFDPDNMAPAMRYWLDCYADELEAVNDRQSAGSSRQSAIKAVEPLVTSKWNQSAPYNNLAPYYNDQGGQCVTGCVATAMAQVMYFHKYPTTGTGSHSYYWVCTEPVGKSGTLSANFGSTTYQWSQMLDNYRNGYTAEQASAVATLMYHCGISIDMGYGQSSGAYTEKVPPALKDYFGYDANYQSIKKIMYPVDSLNTIIYNELKAQRPVIVSGSNDEGGHAFVCDGCDTRSYFHINWGWGGSNDGYYLLTALNPGKSQGIGGTTKGYNKGTTFFIGLQPKKNNTPKAIPQMATTKITVSTSQVNRGTDFTVSIAKLQNYGLTNFSGSYGVALYDEDETTLVKILGQKDNYSLSAGYYRTTAADLTVSIPSASVVQNGTYHLCAVYKDANYGWMRLMCTEDDYYRTIELTNTEATFYANDAAPELTLTAPIAFPEGVSTDSIPYTGMPLSFTVKNTGGTFRGDISARISRGNFSKGQYETADSLIIRRNQSLSSALQQKFDENLLLDTQYKMRLCWRAGAGDSWHDFEPAEYAVLPFKLYNPDPRLALTESIHFDDNEHVSIADANLHYSIQNTGATFDGELQASFYQENFSRGKTDIQQVKIATNETLTGAFSGPLEQVPGTYTVVLRYRNKGGDDWLEFLDAYGNNAGSVTATLYSPYDTIDVPVDITNDQLPYVVDDYYTVPAGTPISSYEVIVKADGYHYHRYQVNVSRCTAEQNYEAELCETELAYEGYGFSIAKADMPAAGESKEYSHTERTARDCDSTTVLTLRITKADTTEVPVSIENDQLPYKVDDWYTVPADAPVDTPFEQVVPTGACAFNRYSVTVSKKPDIQTAADDVLLSGETRQLIMHLGGYDLYLVTRHTAAGTAYSKVLVPAN